MQRTLAPYVAAVLACGLTDMRPAVLPDRSDEAVEFAGDRIDPKVARAAAGRGMGAPLGRRPGRTQLVPLEFAEPAR
jgi:hypothetical protein